MMLVSAMIQVRRPCLSPHGSEKYGWFCLNLYWHCTQALAKAVVKCLQLCGDLMCGSHTQNYNKTLWQCCLPVLQAVVHCTEWTPAGEKDHRRLDVIFGTTFGPAPIAQQESVWSLRWTVCQLWVCVCERISKMDWQIVYVHVQYVCML